MTFARTLMTSTVWGLAHALCRIDDAQLVKVPAQGPLILVINHINFLDVPLLYTHLRPRPLTGLVKKQTWNHPILGPLFSLGGGIPLERGEADVGAFKAALRALTAGQIVAVAPEGTRSNHGRLQRGLPGVVTLALHSGAPLQPVVFFGHERFRRNIRCLRRTDFHFAAGRPFRIQAEGQVRGEQRRQIAQEIMYQVAATLPPEYRGQYENLAAATTTYLRFA